MKKTLKVMLMGMVAFFLLTGSAWAATYTYADLYANWLGYPQSPPYTINPNDTYGIPHIDTMTVITTEGSNYLDTVIVKMEDNNWVKPDYLFINTYWTQGMKYDLWDYGVYTDYNQSVFYSIDEDAYSYNLATGVGRPGHPISIDDGNTVASGYLLGVEWKSSSYELIYTFNTTGSNVIQLGSDEKFVIGYAPYCANDVFLTPVPEPGILLLLGLGLVGVGLVKRRMT